MDNNEFINDVLKDFKLLNGIDNSNNDDLFTLFIKNAVQTILNLTNRYKFPIGIVETIIFGILVFGLTLLIGYLIAKAL